jgi:hypothetical protein
MLDPNLKMIISIVIGLAIWKLIKFLVLLAWNKSKAMK